MLSRITPGTSVPPAITQAEAPTVGKNRASEAGSGAAVKVTEIVVADRFAPEGPQKSNPLEQASEFLRSQALPSSAAIRANFNENGTLNAADANKLMMQVTTARHLLKACAPDLFGLANSKYLPTPAIRDMGHATNQLGFDLDGSAADRKIVSALMDLANGNLDILHAAADKNSSIPNLGVELVRVSEDKTDAELEADGINGRSLRTDHNAAIIGESLRQAKGALESLLPEKFSSKWNYVNTIFRTETNQDIQTVAAKFETLLRTNPSLSITLCTPEGRNLINDLVQGTHLMPWDRASLLEKMDLSLPSAKTVKVVKELGSGANGVVSLARLNGSEVIKKELTPVLKHEREDLMAKTLKEMAVQTGAQNNHHIPKLIGFYETESPYEPDPDFTQVRLNIVTEYVAGGDVKALFEGTQSLPLAERLPVALHMTGGAARGLDVLHRNGLLHLDIKPENIMLDPNTQDARLIDFGEAVLTGDATYRGSLLYMSPEVARNDGRPLTEAADTWSLGASFAEGLGLELWSGKRSPAEITTALASGELPINQDHPIWTNELDAPIKDFILACLNSDPMARPAMAQIVDALNGDQIRAPEEGKPGLRGDDRAILSRVFNPDTSHSGREILTTMEQQRLQNGFDNDE